MKLRKALDRWTVSPFRKKNMLDVRCVCCLCVLSTKCMFARFRFVTCPTVNDFVMTIQSGRCSV